MKKIFVLVTISMLINISAKAQKFPEDFGKYDSVRVDMLCSDTSLPFGNPIKFTQPQGYRVRKITARHFVEVYFIDANKKPFPKNIVVLESKTK